MKNIRLIGIVLLLNILYAFAAKAIDNPAQKQIRENLSKMPILFRENIGQWDKKVLYNGRSPAWDANVQFMRDGISFGFIREAETPESDHEMLVWNLYFENANPNTTVTSLGKENSHTNYLIGNDPTKHKSNVPDYRYIKYENIYENIDIQYYGTGKELKYDFILNPEGDISKIKLKADGIKNLSINQGGILEIETAWGVLQEELPVSYQIIDGKKIVIHVSYKLNENNTFGFKINGTYNASLPLIIDPVNIKWCTYLGSKVAGGDGYLYSLTIDSLENVYATGYFNEYFPITPGVYDQTFNGPFLPPNTTFPPKNKDVIVYKLNAKGTTLDYATYIGGSNQEIATSIKVNQAGEAFVTGSTLSSDFPISKNAYDTTFVGPYETFCIRLSADGSNLIYSTFLSAAFQTQPNTLFSASQIVFSSALAVNNKNEVIVTGITDNNFITTANAFNISFNGGTSDAFLLKLNSTGTATKFATFIGGSTDDGGSDIAFDSKENIYLTGMTKSTNFPTSANAFQKINGGGIDGFIMKFDSVGANIYSTYLGGLGTDHAVAIAISSKDEAIISGEESGSTDFPISTNKLDSTLGQWDGFVTKINTDGSALIFSQLLGGGSTDRIADVAVNAIDEIYLSGFTSGDLGRFPFPKDKSCSYDTTYNSGANDHFIIKIDSAGKKILYTSLLGGESYDYTNACIAIIPNDCKNGNDDVIFGGTTHSGGYPTTVGSYQYYNKSGSANYDTHVITRFTNILADFKFSVTYPTCNLPIVSFADSSSYSCTNFNWNWDFGDGITSTDKNPIHQYDSAGNYTIRLIVSCPNDTIEHSISIPDILPKAKIGVLPSSFALTFDTIQFANTTNNIVSWKWEFGDSDSSTIEKPKHTYTSPGQYKVILAAKDSNGCIAYDTLLITVDQKEKFAVPNIFTPNNDNSNDLFVITNHGLTQYLIEIYDRWGLKMFESTNTQLHWNGKTTGGSIAPDGTYYYIIKAKGVSGKEYSPTGYLQLIR